MVLKEMIEELTDNFIAVITTLAVIYMALNQIVVPDWLIAGYGILLAFYFQNKNNQV